MAGSGTAAPKRLEDEFYRIMRRFNNKNWLHFARSKDGLALPDYQIDDIQQDYSRDTKEQKYQMLTVWKRRNNRATIEYLNRLVDQFFNIPTETSNEPTRNPQPVSDDVRQQEPAQRNLAAAQQLPARENKMQHETAQLPNFNPPSGEPQSLESIRVNSDSLTQNRAYYPPLQEQPLKSQPMTNESLDSLPRSIRVHGNNSIPCRALGDQDSVPMDTSGPSSRPKTTASPIRNAVNYPQLQGASHRMQHLSSNPNVPRVGEPGNTPMDTAGPSSRPKTAAAPKRNTPNHQRPQSSGYSRLHQLSNFGLPGVNFGNTQINVIGEHAIGVQINNHPVGTQKRDFKLTTEQLKNYSSKIEYIDVMPSEKADYFKHFMATDIYRITHTPKGAVLIINNMVCGSKAEQSRSETDVRNFETMWTKMGCKTILRTRSTAEEIKATLKKFANSKTATQSNFIVVAILAKSRVIGNTGLFYGADGDTVNVKDIIKAFDDENAVKIRGIPKLFFLQFCTETPFSALFKKITQEICEVSKTQHMMISHAVQASLDAFSDFPGASWYINAVIRVFMNHAYEQDCKELITWVNAVLRNCPEHMFAHGFSSTLKKKLYFYPGFPEEIEDEF